MALSMEQLRAAFKKQDTNESRPSNYYRFWDMNIDERATVRFLPDADKNNPLGFMVEKLVHNLEINGENKSVPCLKMYGEECPICSVSQAYYKDEGKGSPNGKKYWRNKQHLIQALVVDDPLPADQETGETADGKVKILNIGYQLYSVIKEAFESGDLEEIPYSYAGGCDFVIKKTDFGGKAKYDVGSHFARKESDLSEDQIAMVEDSMVNLSTLLPANPGLEKVTAMLEAALTGESYDDGGQSSGGNDNSTPSTPANESQKPAAEAAKTPKAEEFDDEADDILAKIRKRKAAAAE